MNERERLNFHAKVYPIAKQIYENPKARFSITPILLTKSEYAHAEYLEYNMRYFIKRGKIAA